MSDGGHPWQADRRSLRRSRKAWREEQRLVVWKIHISPQKWTGQSTEQQNFTKNSWHSQKYTSINSVCEQDDAVHYPIEYLNSIAAPGLPPHELKLKIGIPVILLRNLHPPKLCNGTRLRVVSLQNHVIEATILTGCGSGENIFIPRIPIIPSNYPFQFKRLQFPLNVCFAMTINKSQGQTLAKAGIDLSNQCFAHGQLYVACSRVKDSSSITLYSPDKKIKNIVYKEALL